MDAALTETPDMKFMVHLGDMVDSGGNITQWNSYFDALVYMSSTSKYPLQMFLREILINNQVDLNMVGLDPAAAEAKLHLAQVIKYGVIVVASLPVLCVYPFVQKYFVKGVMIGAIKE